MNSRRTRPGRRGALGAVLALGSIVFASASCGADGDVTGDGGTTPPPCTTCPPGADPASFDACGGRIVVNGAIDGAEYVKQALAADRATIDCRLGASFAVAHPGAPDDRPTAYEPPLQTTTLGRHGQPFNYQLGGPPSVTPPADNVFGSANDQVLYAADQPDDPGVARITTYDWESNVISAHPEPVWWGVGHPKGRNTDPAVDVTFEGTKARAWASALGRPFGDPFAIARSSQSWSNDALVVYKPGFFGATGTQTSSSTYPFFQFPKNKVVMAIAVTSVNELTLVALWDTDTKKGQLAVLANLARGLEPYHTWPYFGLPNGGSYTAFKLMGYVDLPFATPTAISASTNVDQPVLRDQQGGWALLDQQSIRDEVRSGPTQIRVATAGYAVVASRWESKVAFIDLQAIFAFLRERYLTTDANFKEASVTDPAAWPYTFDAQPTIAPKVVKVIDVPYPTAVLAGSRRYEDDTRVHVAQLDGTLTTYDASGLGSDAAANPDDIRPIGSVQVGASPTSLAWPRQQDPLSKDASPYVYNPIVIAVSRAERQVSWVTTSKKDGSSVYRRFRDSRLSDPVAIEFVSNAYVATIADFNGKKVVTYRFGPTPDDQLTPKRTIGMGPDGKDQVECGGEMAFPGKVFLLSSTNVN